MGELGSIFEEVERGGDGPRGPDLRAKVDVPRSALGREGGYAALVPDEIEHDGSLVARVQGPGDAPGCVVLHLPVTFASGSVLRLRRQGGRSEGGVPGDLYLQVTVVDPVDDGIRGLVVVFVLALAAAIGVWVLATA
jgi:hypothetical protein